MIAKASLKAKQEQEAVSQQREGELLSNKVEDESVLAIAKAKTLISIGHDVKPVDATAVHEAIKNFPNPTEDPNFDESTLLVSD